MSMLDDKSIDADILRRTFIAIATDRFEDPSWPPLDGVLNEVRFLQAWFCNEALGDHRFQPFRSNLARRPSEVSIVRALKNPPVQRRFRGTYAVVMYVTGHGIELDNAHWIILKFTDATRIRATALRTADLISWLADTDLGHLLVIIDVCHAKGAQKGTVQIEKDFPPGWIGLLTASDQARVGALTNVVHQFLVQAANSEKYGSGREPYLHANDFIEAINQGLWKQYGQRLHLFTPVPIGPSPCLPNPSYNPATHDRVGTTPARQDMAVRRDDLFDFWAPRARGVTRADQPGWLFTGRKTLMRRLLAFVAGPPGALVVTGVAGSGKSAVLSRLVTLSDPAFCSDYSDQLAHIPEDLKPEQGAVDVAVLATGKTTDEVADQLSQALGVDIDDQAAGGYGSRMTSVDQTLRGLHAYFTGRSEPVTVVVDGLDEAQDAVGLLLSLLGQLNPPSGPSRVRLLIGVRAPAGRTDDPASDASSHRGPLHPTDSRPFDARGRSLVELAMQTLTADEVRVDESPFWDPDDLVDYTVQVLNQPAPGNTLSPYLSNNSAARRVGSAVASAVAPSFLAARIIAQALTRRDEVQDINDPAWRTLIDQGLRGILRDELHQAFPGVDQRTRAVHLLRAIAFGRGRGLPWRNIWPRVATAVAGDGRLYGDSDIDWLLSQPISGYLLRDLEDGVTVYRLFHESLREGLRDEPVWYLDEADTE